MPDIRSLHLNQPDTANLVGYLLAKAGRYLMMFDPMTREMYGTALNNCIMAGRIATEVMKHYGVRNARAEAVEVYVGNALFREMCDEHGRPPLNATEADAWWKAGAYASGASGKSKKPETPGTWNGHLVCIAENVLVDLSLDQFNRPQHGIEVDTFYGNVGWEFLDGRERATFMTDDGCLIAYGLETWNTTWKTSGDWIGYPSYRHIVERIVQEIDSIQESGIGVQIS